MGRHAGILAASTILSRITGLLRDAAILAVFGAVGSGLWFAAWRLPNAMRRLMAEGSLTISFIPLFSRRLAEEGRESARRFLDRTFTVALLGVGAVTALAVWGMPAVLGLIAHDWRRQPESWALAVRLARWTFPYLVPVTLVAVAMGVLNTLRRFFVPAVSNVLVNLTVLAGVLLLAPRLDTPLLAPAYALLFGGVLQLGANLVAMARTGYAPRPTLGLRDPSLRRLGRLMAPATFGASIHQVNILLSTAFATTLGKAPIAWLYAADRLVEAPLGIIAMSVAAASLPELSQQAVEARWVDFKDTLHSGLRHVLYLLLPAATGLGVLALPITAVVYLRGQVTWDDTLASAGALACYALGLPAIGASRVTVQGFYALEDTRTPVRIGLVSVAAFATAAALLLPGLGHLGIALAVSLSGWLNFGLALGLLRRKVGRLGLSRLVRPLVRSAAGLLALGAAAVATAHLGDWTAGVRGLDAASLRNVLALGAAIAAGAAAYFGTTWGLGSTEARALAGALGRRLHRWGP